MRARDSPGVAALLLSVIMISPILWLVGRSTVGGAKAKFTDAIPIVVLRIIINAILGTFVHGADFPRTRPPT